MATSTGRWRPSTFLVALLLIACPVLSAEPIDSAAPKAETRATHVLYINSYNRGYSWSDAIEAGLADTLKGFGSRIDLSVEYLDSRRFPNRDHEEPIALAMAFKYANPRPDVVVVSDNDAFDFAMTYRDTLFPGVPVVFCGYNSFRPDVLKGIRNVTGVNEEEDFSGTIDLALRLHPTTEALVFIGSTVTRSGVRNLQALEKFVFPVYRNRYSIRLLKDLPMEEMARSLAALRRGSLVFLVGGPNATDPVELAEFARRISSASPVPVYTFWDFYFGSGAMGGSIITGTDQGRAAGRLALQILRGTPADRIPVIMETPTTAMFDFNALRRFALSEAALPPGSVVINRPYSLYDQYRSYLWAAATVFLFLSALVVLLLVLLRRSRRLGMQLGASERRFRVLVEQAPEAIVVFDVDDMRILDCNANACRLSGYSREQLLKLRLEDLYSNAQPDGNPIHESVQANIERVLSGEELAFERRLRRATAESFPCEVRTVLLPSAGRRLIRASIIDISRRKRMQEALEARQAKLESILRGAPVGIGEVMGRTVTLANNRLCTMLGYAADELLGQSTRVVFSSDDQWNAVQTEGIGQMMKNGYANVETTLWRKDGTPIDVIFSASPIAPNGMEQDHFTIIVMDVTELKSTTKALAGAFANLKELSTRLLNAQEIERRTIANELHDEIGQGLTAITLKLHTLSQRVQNHTATQADVESCMQLTSDVLRQVRGLSLNLRPPQLELLGLASALKWLFATRAEGANLEVHFAARVKPDGRPSHVDIVCFRIVQEALTNVIRHSGARNLWVDLIQEADCLKLYIRDDGSGFDPESAKERAVQGGSIGLLSMDERITLVGGSLEVESAPGAGTSMRVMIPLNPSPVETHEDVGTLQ